MVRGIAHVVCACVIDGVITVLYVSIDHVTENAYLHTLKS